MSTADILTIPYHMEHYRSIDDEDPRISAISIITGKGQSTSYLLTAPLQIGITFSQAEKNDSDMVCLNLWRRIQSNS